MRLKIGGVLWAVWLAMAAPAWADQGGQMTCTIGPLHRIYGATAWLVYGCTDNRSLTVVSAPGNPAAPYYFLISPGLRGYQIYGEGTGSAAAAAAALAQLQTLTIEDVKTLRAQTEHH